MTAEGWDGASIKHHVEAAHGVAQAAYTAALENEETLDDLLVAIGQIIEGQAKILAALDILAGGQDD